jgi:hypothetical protein
MKVFDKTQSEIIRFLLKVPVTKRVDFMSKYSTASYCSGTDIFILLYVAILSDRSKRFHPSSTRGSQHVVSGCCVLLGTHCTHEGLQTYPGTVARTKYLF